MKVINTALFWLHGVVILAAVILGWFIHPLAAVTLIFLHELQLKLFGGCVISLVQFKSGSLRSADENFLQAITYKLTNRKIDKLGVRKIDLSLKVIMLSLSAISFQFFS